MKKQGAEKHPLSLEDFVLKGPKKKEKLSPEQKGIQYYLKIFFLIWKYGAEALRYVVRKRFIWNGPLTDDGINTNIEPYYRAIEFTDEETFSLLTNENNRFIGIQHADVKMAYLIIKLLNGKFTLCDDGPMKEEVIKTARRLKSRRNTIAHSLYPPIMSHDNFEVEFKSLKMDILFLLDLTKDTGDYETMSMKIDQIKTMKFTENPQFSVLNDIVGLWDKKTDKDIEVSQKATDENISKEIEETFKAITEIFEEKIKRYNTEVLGEIVTLTEPLTRGLKPFLERSSSLTLANTNVPIWASTEKIDDQIEDQTTSHMLDMVYLNNVRYLKCEKALKSHYKSTYKENYITNSINEKMVDIIFKSSNKEDIVESVHNIFETKQKPHRIVLTGEKGSGKSVIVTRMVKEWTENSWEYHIPLLVNLKEMPTPISVMDFICNKLLAGCEFKLPEIYKMLDSHQDQFLLILDGLEEFHRENSREIYQLMKGDWMKKLNVLITTTTNSVQDLVIHESFTNYRLDLSAEDMDRYINECMPAVKAERLTRWIEESKIVSSLRKEPLLLSFLCDQWKNDHNYRSPRDLCEAMVNKILLPNLSDDNFEMARQTVENLALLASIFGKNILLLGEEEEAGSNHSLKSAIDEISQYESKLFCCEEVLIDDRHQFEIDFYTPTIQAYLAIRCLEKNRTGSSSNSQEILRQCEKNAFHFDNLLKLLKRTEALLFGVEIEMSPSSTLVALRVHGPLLDDIKYFLSDEDKKIIEEMAKLGPQLEDYGLESDEEAKLGIESMSRENDSMLDDGQDIEEEKVAPLGKLPPLEGDLEMDPDHDMEECEGNELGATEILQEADSVLEDISGNLLPKISLVFDREYVMLIGISTSEPKQLLKSIEMETSLHADIKPIMYVALTSKEWSQVKQKTQLVSLLEELIGKAGRHFNHMHDLDIKDVHLGRHFSRQDRKQLFISYGCSKRGRKIYRCVTIRYDNEDIWENMSKNIIDRTEKLVHISLNPYNLDLSQFTCTFAHLSPVACAKIKSIDVSDVFLGDHYVDILANSLNDMFQLEHLDLEGCRMETEQAMKVITSLQKLTNLKYLSFQTNCLSGTTANLKEVLNSNTQIQHLSVNNCQINRTEMNDILEGILVSNLEITFLDLGYNCVPKDGVVNVLKSLSNLKTLLLRHVRISREDLKSLFSVLKAGKIRTHVECLDISEITSIRGFEEDLLTSFPALQHLYLSDLSITTEGLDKVTSSLKESKIRLETLDISNNFIGSEGAGMMKSIYLYNIKHFDVHNCGITFEIIGDVVRKLHKQKLTWLDLGDNIIGNDGCGTLADILVTNIVHLNLKNCRIGCDGIKNLSGLIARNERLRFLELSDNLFAYDIETIAILGKTLCSTVHLEHLGLENCDLDENGLTTLARTICEMKKGKSLNLSGNCIYDEDCMALGVLLKKFAKLEKLTLGKYMSNNMDSIFTSLLSKDKNIKYLDFEDNYFEFNVDSNLDNFIKLLKQCECLEKLDISGSNLMYNVRQKIIDALKDKSNFSYLKIEDVLRLCNRNDIMSTHRYNEKFEGVYLPNFRYYSIKVLAEHLVVKWTAGGSTFWLHSQFMLDNDVKEKFVEMHKIASNRLTSIVMRDNIKDIYLEFIYKLTIQNLADLNMFENYTPNITEIVFDKAIFPPNMLNLPMFFNLKHITFYDSDKNQKPVEFYNSLEILKALQTLDIDGYKEYVDGILGNICTSSLRQLKVTLKNPKSNLNFSGFSNLNKLHLQNISLPDFTFITDMRQLEHIYIHLCTYNHESLIQILKSSYFLRTLSLKLNNETNKNLAGFFAAMNNLTNLEQFEHTAFGANNAFVALLSTCGFQILRDPETYEKLAPKIQTWKKEAVSQAYSQFLKTFSMGDFLTCNITKNLRKLTLGDYDVTNAGAIALANDIANFQNLTELNLPHCNIFKEGCTVLFQTIRHLPKLETFDLSYNFWFEVDADIIKQGLGQLKHLKTLCLNNFPEYDKTILNAVTSAKYLKTIHMRHIYFTPNQTDGKRIAEEFVEICKQLKFLRNFYFSAPENKEFSQHLKGLHICDNGDFETYSTVWQECPVDFIESTNSQHSIFHRILRVAKLLKNANLIPGE